MITPKPDNKRSTDTFFRLATNRPLHNPRSTITVPVSTETPQPKKTPRPPKNIFEFFFGVQED